MLSSFNGNGYSSNVRLHLVVGDRTLELAQIGPNDIVLRTPTDLPPGDAEIIMEIDGHERRWPIHLPQGASVNTPTTATITAPVASW
jgi:hypothetical protein